jgi:hypothetical protein
MNLKPLRAVSGALVLTALACQFLPGSSGSSSGALFEDDFSNKRNGWDENSGENAASGFADEEYTISIYPTSWFAWANPEGADLALSNVHLEVTARSVGAATEPGFGIMCNYLDADNTYYLGVSTDGYYAIVKTVGGEDTVLSDVDSWIQSDAIPVNASSYRLGVDCGNGTLALAVNGTAVATVSDATFSSGTVGLFAQTFAEPNAEIRFDDFVAVPLP